MMRKKNTASSKPTTKKAPPKTAKNSFLTKGTSVGTAIDIQRVTFLGREFEAEAVTKIAESEVSSCVSIEEKKIEAGAKKVPVVEMTFTFLGTLQGESIVEALRELFTSGETIVINKGTFKALFGGDPSKLFKRKFDDDIYFKVSQRAGKNIYHVDFQRKQR